MQGKGKKEKRQSAGTIQKGGVVKGYIDWPGSTVEDWQKVYKRHGLNIPEEYIQQTLKTGEKMRSRGEDAKERHIKVEKEKIKYESEFSIDFKPEPSIKRRELNDTEKQILDLKAEGKTWKEISNRLFPTSPNYAESEQKKVERIVDGLAKAHGFKGRYARRDFVKYYVEKKQS